MAILTSDDLSLEIVYREFEFGWVWYDIWFRWRGESILNDAVLKRVNEHWDKRGHGAISAAECECCTLLPFLKKLFQTWESGYWQPMEVDVILAAYTDRGFPFLPSNWVSIYTDPAIIAREEERAAQRAVSGPLPDDWIELILFADVYTFTGATAYGGPGIGLRIGATHERLQNFYESLRAEYVAFRERYAVDAYHRAGPEGPIYVAPDF